MRGAIIAMSRISQLSAHANMWKNVTRNINRHNDDTKAVRQCLHRRRGKPEMPVGSRQVCQCSERDLSPKASFKVSRLS